MVICFILWQLFIFLSHLLNFPHFGVLYQEKSGNPAAYARLPCCSSCEIICTAGIDFMELDCGRKVFGQILTLEFQAGFHPN
jgi:hypothetical protein